MLIYAIGHKSRQGKDELANFMATHLRVHTRNKRIVKVGFADVLKAVCHQLYSWCGVKEGDHYETHINERTKELQYFQNGNVVDLWINLGNHMRSFDPHVWINALLRGTKADVMIIKDCRFPNECEAVKQHGGTLIKVTRPGENGLPSVSDNILNDFEGWDHHVVNDQTLKELYNKAVVFCDSHIIPKLG